MNLFDLERYCNASEGVRFIVLRGEPGSGKTLVVNMLEDALSKNPPYVCKSYPEASPLGISAP